MEAKNRVTPQPHEVSPNLELRHREALLDVVLAWGALDGALGILLAAAEDIELDVAAHEFGKMPTSDKLARLRRNLPDNASGKSTSMFFKKLKKNLERNSFVRNRVVHSRCVGIWEKDPEYVLFAAFEQFSDGHLAFDAIPLEELVRVAQWAERVTELALHLSDKIRSTTPKFGEES